MSRLNNGGKKIGRIKSRIKISGTKSGGNWEKVMVEQNR